MNTRYLNNISKFRPKKQLFSRSCIGMVCTYICMLFLSMPIYAEKNLTTHYIIAFDQAVPLYRHIYLSPMMINTLDRVLDDNGYKKGIDYVSMVAYALENNPSMDRFVRPYKDVKGNEILWKRYKYGLAGNLEKWPSGQPLLNIESGSPSSMQSIAKPYIVMETKEKGDSSRVVDKTILLMVTDDVVNGSDDNYQQEWYRVKGISGANFGNYTKIESDVFNTMRKFNEEFKFVRDTINYNFAKRSQISLSPDGQYRIIPYEVVSAEKPSIHSVTDMPSPLPLKRVRGGFRVSTNVSSINPKYSIKDILITGKRRELLGQSNDGNFDFLIPSDKVSAGDTIDIAMSLLLKDGFYNRSLISYKNDRYKAGMTNRQVIKLQDEAKVMGLIPLYDTFWWWFPNNVTYAVLLWDLIIVIIFVLLIMYLIKRFSTYTPSSDKVTLRPVERKLKNKNN